MSDRGDPLTEVVGDVGQGDPPVQTHREEQISDLGEAHYCCCIFHALPPYIHHHHTASKYKECVE